MTGDRSTQDTGADDADRQRRGDEPHGSNTRTDDIDSAHNGPGRRLGALDSLLETHDYPTTTSELIDAFGDREVQTQGGEESVAELLDPASGETFHTADEARHRILRLVRRR